MMQRLISDWEKNPLSNPFSFKVAAEKDDLTFTISFEIPSTVAPASEFQNYQSELWRYDVGELFLANPNTGEYLEINLNEAGAWWMQKFCSIRTADEFHTKEDYSSAVIVERQEEGVSLIVKTKFLESLLGLPVYEMTANATAIVGQPQQFSSFAKIDKPEPDFHQPSYFPPIRSLIS